MTARLWTSTAWLRVAIVAASLFVAGVWPAAAQNVMVTTPTIETFVVQDVDTSEGGSGTTISWSSGDNFAGNHLRISVKADVPNFTPPSAGRSAIPATKVSWTIASATNGTGSSGTLSSSAYTVVYNGVSGATSGSVSMDWILAATGSNVRGGSHQLTLHWKLESVP